MKAIAKTHPLPLQGGEFVSASLKEEIIKHRKIEH
jgi:hypothetical protein